MDAFYASVEERDNPTLIGKPIIVGGDPDRRGVVASASYEARRFGIRSAMSSAMAKRLCPHAVFLFPDISKYRNVSEKIHEIFDSITHLVEPLSLDEAYLDVTTNLLNEPLARNLAVLIKKRIKEELRLTASAGVGPNKFIAKLASDFKKPDGLVVVPPEKVDEFVAKLPVEKFWGVGPATAKRLHEAGLWSAADIRAASLGELTAAVGKLGAFLKDLSFGIDDREVEIERESKSSGTETTFDHDILDAYKLQSQIRQQAEELSADLKKSQRPARTITLKVKYSDFISITRSKTLLRATDEVETIANTAIDLLLNATEAGIRPIRLVGVSVSGFLKWDEPEQLWFDFPDPAAIR